jgi:hypothetical protein
MKKSIISILLIASLFTAMSVHAQNCDFYFPVKKGSLVETTNYDKKGKATGVGTATVLDFIASGTSQTVKVASEYKSADSDSLFKSEYSVKCENGEFYINMDNFLDQKSMSAYKNMEIKVDCDQMKMPSNLQAGQVLGDGRVTAKISNSGVNLMTMNVLITNRKVFGNEQVTTPAGTFDCVKITYDVETKMIFKAKASCAQWFAKNIGVVKYETYDKKGKVETYSLITKIK